MGELVTQFEELAVDGDIDALRATIAELRECADGMREDKQHTPLLVQLTARLPFATGAFALAT